MTAQPFRGVLVPVLTPFTRSGEPDGGRFIAFCRWLLDQGAGGLAIFGTTSEANSMSGAERMALLDRLIEAGIPAEKLMPGTGACSMSEAAALARHAVGNGCGGVLMLPPFYYKGVSDEGIFAFVPGVIDRVGSPALRVYLYHIPPVAQVGFSLDLVGRLITAYPGYGRRVEGQLRRLEQHRGIARALSGIRDLPRLRGLPARCAAQGRGRMHHRIGQRQRPRHPQGLRELEDAAGRCAAGRDHHLAQGAAGIPDGAGVEAHRRAFPQRPGLGRGAAADGAARRGAVRGADRGPRQTRLQPRRSGRASLARHGADDRRPSGKPSTTGSRRPISRRSGSSCTRW